jgi:hypothetical protein
MTAAFALIRANLNSSESEVISTHTTEDAAYKAADKFSGTTGTIGLYVAHRKPDGHWETRLEARDRAEAA